MSTMTYTGTLTVLDCCYAECGVTFGIPAQFQKERRDDHRMFYCPNGHQQGYTGPSKTEQDATDQRNRAERAEQQARWAQERADRLRMERDAVEYRRRAMKGQVTKLRNRIAAGVCPVQSCRRNFANVKAHVESQHPDWAHDHPEALS